MAEWKNFAYEIYKEIMGEDVFRKKMDEANKPQPPPSCFSSLQFAYHMRKIKFAFGAAALSTGKRPTHGNGIGATGMATIVSQPQFPACEFFTPGSSYPVRLRHSNAASGDDTCPSFPSASLKFADSDDESPLDLILNTGECPVLWNVQSLYDAMTSNLSGNSKEYLLLSPLHLWSNIEGLRRTPDSHYDQRYYSEAIYDFKAKDDVTRYARFRMMPADGTPETGRLTEEQQRKAWEKERYPDETRPQDYLRQEFKERVSKGPVHYRLQLQLHEARPDDSPHVLNISKKWDVSTHPWLDLADVIITSLIPPDVTERTRYNAANMPSCLGLLPFKTIHDSSCVMHIRTELYQWTQKLRLLRPPHALPDHMTNYLIQVETGDQSGAGTDAKISVTLVGTKGRSDAVPLGGWSFHNDFEAGQLDEYNIEAMDVGEVLLLHLHNDRGGWWYKNPDWFVNNITVINTKNGKSCQFPCYRWVLKDLTVFRGQAALPQKEQLEVLKQNRHLELVENQNNYKWGTLEGLDNLPGYIHAPSHSDIPRNSQFSDVASRSFNTNRLRAVASLGLAHLYTLFDTWDGFEDFKKLFLGWVSEVPKYANGDQWMDDRVFGMQFLNGCNPCIIRRCEKLPPNFPVTNDHVKEKLDRGLTLEQEMKDGHIYIVSYEELQGIRRSGQDKGGAKLRYTVEPLALFYVTTSGDLVPIAIQFYQEPSETNPIWTPSDAKYDWLLAKMWLRNADHQVHQMHSHLLNTHLLMETVAVGTWRQLSSMHPVFKLLFNHVRSVMAINTLGRNELINKGGISDKTLSIGGGGHVELLKKNYKTFKWSIFSIPDTLKERGVHDPEKLPNFHYRDDALRLWEAITNFVQEFIFIYYKSDDDVKDDTELQAWMRDMHENGYPVRPGDVDHEFPESLQTRDQLVHLVTCVVFNSSCQHAAVNFGQLEVTSFIPNAPPVMRRPPPSKKNEVDHEYIMETLPNKSQAGWHIATMFALTRFAADECYLGDYSKAPIVEDEAHAAIGRFQDRLEEISKAIKSRNQALEWPYIYLLPERVPSSIAI